MSIYREFHPTYLYIKQHAVTGKLYFGKTITKDIEKYKGSGTLWLRHINKHGKEYVVTLWCELFTDEDLIREFALSFSRDMNIVESKQWLNLKFEDGSDGGDNFTNNPNKEQIREQMRERIGEKNGMYGRKHTEESITKMRNNKKGQRKGIPTWNKGKILSIEQRVNMSGRSGSKSASSHTYKFISPDNVEYIFIGEFIEFCNKYELCPHSSNYYKNKGKIGPAKLSAGPKRKNLTGWEIIDLDRM